MKGMNQVRSKARWFGLLAAIGLATLGCSSDDASGARCNPLTGACGGSGGSTGQSGSSCNGDIDCTPGSICWNAVCIGSGSLRFSLAWDVTSDFDLHVQMPDGTEVYYGNRNAEGANLDVDDCVGNSCRNPAGTHVENIYWASPPPRGTYLVWVENYNGGAAGTFTIEVGGGGGGPFTGSLPATSGAASEQFTVTY